MSYGVSAALQAAVFQQLSGDAQVSTLSGGAIYDAVERTVYAELA